MTQITQGIKTILFHPKVYNLFQKIMGAHHVRKTFMEQFIKPYPGMKILDIGCGTAEILPAYQVVT